MKICIVTGSAGLIGAEAVRFFSSKGFVSSASTTTCGSSSSATRHRRNGAAASWNRRSRTTCTTTIDIRDREAIESLFAEYGADIELIVHTAAQPSHDWAAKDPHTDFSVNANGTLILLEATRKFCPQASFIFTSTNKVYGDNPNRLPLVELETRWEIDAAHPYYEHGIDETSVGRPDQALAVRRLEARGRRDGAGVRPLLRHEHRLLPRRLPDRAGPLGHHDARVPVVSGQVRVDGDAVHGLRLQGQAGPRQHPLAATW